VKRPATVSIAVIALAACGGSTLREAPRAASGKACVSTRDAAEAASSAVFTNTGRYPASFTEMTTGRAPALIAGQDTKVAADTLAGKGWTLTMHGGGATAPVFTCASSPLG
jgi:hypothetical protein